MYVKSSKRWIKCKKSKKSESIVEIEKLKNQKNQKPQNWEWKPIPMEML